jgi:hypothetical protein
MKPIRKFFSLAFGEDTNNRTAVHRNKHRARLRVEYLEDRVVPTVQSFPVMNGVLTVNGDQLTLPTNDIIAVDTTPTGGVSVTLNNETVTFDPGKVSSIVINPGGSFNGHNFVDIRATDVPVTINDCDPRGDIVHIGKNSRLQGIAAPITLQNESPWTSLTVDDVADPAYQSIDISANDVQVCGIPDIVFNGDALYQLTVAAGGPRATMRGSIGNFIDIRGIASNEPLVPRQPPRVSTPVPNGTSVTVDTGFGNNLIFARWDLDAFRGWLNINGQGLSNRFSIDDSLNAGAHNYDLESGSFSRSGMPNFWTFHGIDYLYLTGAEGPNTFTVGSVPWNVQTFISGGISNANTLAGPTGTVDWSISGPNSGSLALNGAAADVHFTNIQNLRGSTGVDTFQFATGGVVNSIDGGGGGDWLDYSTSGNAPVSVNLATGQATGVQGSIANIRNVLGDNGNDVLVGGAGGNILIGGEGSNTLIGGADGNLLIGGFGQANTLTAGTFGDILIGGWTDFDSSSDAHRAALQSILNEWRFDDPLLRIPRLITGGQGLNGNNLLNIITVHHNLAADTLIAGVGLDWFFVQSGVDIVTGLKMNDQFYYY